MAPSAKVVYVGANSCQDADFIAAGSDIIDHHLATIVTSSWDGDLYETNGKEPTSTINKYEQLFEQGASAIGIGKNDNYLWETGIGDSETTTVDETAWSTEPLRDPALGTDAFHDVTDDPGGATELGSNSSCGVGAAASVAEAS
jgi:hypothetical protein